MNSYSRGSIKRVGRFGSWPTRTITFEDTELDWENNVARSKRSRRDTSIPLFLYIDRISRVLVSFYLAYP